MEAEVVFGVIMLFFGMIGFVTVGFSLKRLALALIWGNKEDRMRAIGWDSQPTVKD